MNDKKNKKVMSIAIEPELHDNVKEYVKRKGLSASEYIGDLIKKGVKINIDDDPMVIGVSNDGRDVLPVVLKIPSQFKGNKESLTEWLNTQSSAIVKKLAP